MIVVDLGCWNHGNPALDSISSLIAKYQPEILYGFDPLATDGVVRWGETIVVTRALAAWLHDGMVPFKVSGTGSGVGIGKDKPCFHLVNWLRTIPEPIVLKMDIEGAEWSLVKKIKRTMIDKRISLRLVEKPGQLHWPELRCPVEEWWM